MAGLLAAIALVEALPDDHPLRAQVNQQVEEWARDILNLAEKDYQAGNLQQAITKARQIPNNMAVAAIIEERIAKWQGTWTEGNDILSKLEENLRASNWNQSFRLAVDLLNLNNEYWATVKYNEALAKITVAREEVGEPPLRDEPLVAWGRWAPDRTAKPWRAAYKTYKKILKLK